ncbi:hypothetical protein BHE74_00008409 [Ensete ventricosum]|nr:hypothetical protein BHE74_00008409 [Ensete ventricosum]
MVWSSRAIAIDEVVAVRRCSGRGVVESGCGSEDSNDRGSKVRALQRGAAVAAREDGSDCPVVMKKRRSRLRQRRAWLRVAGRQQQQHCCARQCCGRGGSNEGLAIAGCALPRVGRRQWQGGTGGKHHRGVRQRSVRLGAMGGSKDGGGLRGKTAARSAVGSDGAVESDEGCGRGEQQRAGRWRQWQGLGCRRLMRRGDGGREEKEAAGSGLQQRESLGTGDKVAGSR